MGNAEKRPPGTSMVGPTRKETPHSEATRFLQIVPYIGNPPKSPG